jgi:hypothetical protein
MVRHFPAAVARCPQGCLGTGFAHVTSLSRRLDERRYTLRHGVFSNGTFAAYLAYDKRTMESIRKRVKVITWLLIAALVVGTGAGLLSGVL